MEYSTVLFFVLFLQLSLLSFGSNSRPWFFSNTILPLGGIDYNLQLYQSKILEHPDQNEDNDSINGLPDEEDNYINSVNPYFEYLPQDEDLNKTSDDTSNYDEKSESARNNKTFAPHLEHSLSHSQVQKEAETARQLHPSGTLAWLLFYLFNFVFFIPREIIRFINSFINWFTRKFSRKSQKNTPLKTPPSHSQKKDNFENFKSNTASLATPSPSSFSDPTTKRGVTPAQHQQILEKTHKNSNSFFFAFISWIPFTSTHIQTTPVKLDSTSLPKEHNDDVVRNLQSPYHSLTSPSRKDTDSSVSSSQEYSQSSISASIEKPKTRHSRKSSSSSRTKSGKSSSTHSPSKQSKDFSESQSATKKRKSPIAYAFRFPRIYAPPRPLLPPLTHKVISFWDLFSSKKTRNAALMEPAPEITLLKPKKSPKHTRSSSTVSHSSSTDIYLSSPLSPSNLRISSNANAIHNRRLKKKTLVLDLDETLIHTLSKATGFSQGHMVEVKFRSQFTTLYTVLKRPFCDEFLDQVSQWYNLVVFTASVQAYADPMIDWLERDRKYFVQRYYRQHCTSTPMGYVKDLEIVDPDLSNVMIIDNSPISYTQHESNGIGIEGWINDPSDTSLMAMIPFLSALRFTTDVRCILGLKSGDQSFQA